MKDSCGFEITEGLYEDQSGFYYYHIKETPQGLMKKESGKENYSLLDTFIALDLRRIAHQKELINLVLSCEKELVAQSSAKCTRKLEKLERLEEGYPDDYDCA